MEVISVDVEQPIKLKIHWIQKRNKTQKDSALLNDFKTDCFLLCSWFSRFCMCGIADLLYLLVFALLTTYFFSFLFFIL